LTDTALRQVRKWLEDYQLRVCAVRFASRRGYGDLDGLERRLQATRAAMQLAYRLGSSVVVNQIGQVPAKAQGAQWDLLLASLTDLGRYGQRVGALLSAQTGSEPGEDLARLIAALPPGSITVTLNPGNLVVNNFSVSEAVRALGAHVAYVHARDGVRDLGRGRGADVPLGRGSVDFVDLLGVLEEQGYQGYFTVDREGLAPSPEEIASAVRFLQNISR
jgi:sugar phosphate isomerase/epimerase